MIVSRAYRAAGMLLLAAAAAGLGACTGGGGFMSPSEPGPVAVAPAMPMVPPAVAPTEIIGRWGYAAYHKAEDRARTEANARTQCKQPFVIGAGPSGGLMMYPADSNRLEEMRVKGAPGGKTYIGPGPEPGSMQDREITSFDGRVMTMRFVDPEIAGRYGTGIYVRCGPRA
jgi:hypothetical protein